VPAGPGLSNAVRPLEDMSAGHDQGYFSDGMAEELQSRLAQVPGLLVAGRTSSQSFKGKEATIAQVGKALDVGNVLEGSVRKDGDRLRVTMRLSNVATGFQTWTQTYDRKLTDVFAVQDDIAGAVVETLKLKLMAGGSGPAEGTRRHTPSFAVYDYYLRAREAMKRTDGSTFALALANFTKATELDPAYADAWSGRAMAESFVGEQSPDPVVRAAADKRARAAADRAVALDPMLGDAYGTRGYLRTRAWDWDGALADVEKAVALDPRDARNHLRQGFLLATLGRLPEARAALEQGARADPLLTPVWLFIARVAAAQGDYDGARRALARVEQIEPGTNGPVVYRGVIALLEGDAVAANAGMSRSVHRYTRDLGAYALASPAARPALRRAMAEGADAEHFGAAEAFAWIGDADAAFRHLDAVVDAHDDLALAIPYDPLLRNLHADPRYTALLARMGLPPPPSR
jgi:TolB-like protein/tetratricopeptide (TPR) repeat protein